MSAVSDKIAKYYQENANSPDVAQTKLVFLTALAERGLVIDASRRAGIHRNTAYIWRNQDSDFRKAWDTALEEASDVVEGSLYDNALKGNVVAQIFYLKNNRPKYRDKLPVDLATAQREIENRVREMTAGITNEDSQVQIQEMQQIPAAQQHATSTKEIIAEVLGIPRKPHDPFT